MILRDILSDMIAVENICIAITIFFYDLLHKYCLI